MLGTKIYKNNMQSYPDCAAWCNANGAIIIDRGEYWEVASIPSPTLGEAKTLAVAALKEARDTAEVQPIEVDGTRFDYDDKARERINAAIIALDGTELTLSWTTADNTETIVNGDDLKAIVRAVAARSNELHVKYREQKIAIEQKTTIDEIRALLAEEGLCL